MENEGAILRAVMERTFSVYDQCLDQWREDSWFNPDDIERFMPRLKSPEGFKKLMCLRDVVIEEAEEEGVARIKFYFDCTWDDEHGWEENTHKDRVVE